MKLQHGKHETSIWQTRNFNLANTKLQPDKHETSAWQIQNCKLAKAKLQPGKHETSTWQTRNFTLASTKLQPGKHETSTWQTRNFNVEGPKLQPGKHETSTWQTRNLNLTSTNRFSCAISANWDKMSRLEKFSGHCSDSIRATVVTRKNRVTVVSHCSDSKFRVTATTRVFESL